MEFCLLLAFEGRGGILVVLGKVGVDVGGGCEWWEVDVEIIDSVSVLCKLT